MLECFKCFIIFRGGGNVRPYWYEERTCPVCGNTFQVKILRSGYAYKVLSIDLDLFPNVEGEHPILYEVDICPKCGYANYRKEFAKVPVRDKASLIKFLVKVPTSDKVVGTKPDRTPEDALKIYYWVYKLLEFAQSPKHKLGLTLHKMAWLYRLIGDDKKEKEYLEKALSMYEAALADTKERYNSRDVFIKVIYYAGVLSYMLGHYEKSVQYFNDLLKLEQHGERLSPVIRKHVFDIWQELRRHVSSLSDIGIKEQEEEELSEEILLGTLRKAYHELEGKLSVREMDLPKDKKSIYVPLKRFYLALSHIVFLEDFKRIDAAEWKSFIRIFHRVMDFYTKKNAKYIGVESGYEMLFDGKNANACIVIAPLSMVDEYLKQCGNRVKNILIVGIIETEEDEMIHSDLEFDIEDEGMWLYSGKLYACFLLKK